MRLPRYADVRHSGLAWLGMMPSHWDVTPLKHLVDLRSGGTPSKDNRAYWDGDVPWASAKDMKVDRLGTTADCITQHALECNVANLVPTGAILVVVRGMILARVFPVAETLAPMAINQDLKAVLAREGMAAPFLAWLLRGTAGESLLRLDEAGHGTKALRMDAWTSMKMPVPPFDEQVAIAAFLDHETAKIDALIAEQEKLIALLAEKRQATISHAVTRGLDPIAPMKDSGVAWLGEVPAHWEVVQLRRVVEAFEQGWSPECESRQIEGDEWGVLKAGCVNGGVFNADEHKALPSQLEPRAGLAVHDGDVLMCRASGSPNLIGSVARLVDPPPRLMLSDKIFRLKLSPEIDAVF